MVLLFLHFSIRSMCHDTLHRICKDKKIVSTSANFITTFLEKKHLCLFFWRKKREKLKTYKICYFSHLSRARNNNKVAVGG